MARPRLTAELSAWIDQLALVLDERVAWRLQPLLAGLLFAVGRRTVSSWLRAGQLFKDYQDYYYFLGIVGRKAQSLADRLLGILLRTVEPGERVLLGIDDTPSKRYGPKVEGAGVHHNPTPGPAGAKYVYVHNWVTLAWLTRHPFWGAIGLPLLARMYVRRKDVVGQQLTALRGVTFQTKLVMAAELVRWAAARLHGLGLTGRRSNLASVLLHESGGQRGPDSGSRGRSFGIGTGLSRRQRGPRRRSGANA
jgi:DDE superfamily endonuclease